MVVLRVFSLQSGLLVGRNRRRFFSVRGSEGCVCMGLSLEGGKTRWKEGGVGNRLEEEEGSGGN